MHTKLLRRLGAAMLALVIGLAGLGLPAGGAVADAAASSDPDGFIKGVDISTLQALEDKGVAFYDDGTERDLLAILKEHGVNYVRLRLWNDPVQADGYNDKAHLIEMAKRVKAAGMGLLVDFHYSDFWADPGQQVKPAAWASLGFDELKAALYGYTREVMDELLAEGAYPDMVQIGNEINSGMLLPDGSTSRFAQLAQLLSEGVRAVRETTPAGHETKIMLHLAEGGSNAKFRTFFDQARLQGIDYDVIGLSYYPYWHGTFQELKSNMDDLAARYGKEVVVAETAYPYTLEDADGHGNIAGEAQTKLTGFEASVASQKLVTELILNTVAHVQGGKGLGVFYWEPAWLAGVGWKAGEGNAWENQAMFDFDGNALESLDAFRFVPGDLDDIKPLLVYPSLDVTASAGSAPELPAEAEVLLSEGSIEKRAVVWDEPADPEQWKVPGTYALQGSVQGVDAAMRAAVTVKVVDNPNLVRNPGFEQDGLAGWTLSGTEGAAKLSKEAGNAHSGGHSVNYYYGTEYGYRISQTVTGLENGTYRLSAWASGGGGETKLRLFAEGYGGDPLGADAVNAGWNVWKPYAVEEIEVTNGQVTIGFDVEAPGGTWGYLDDFELVKAPEKNPVQNPGFESGDLTGWTLGGTAGAGKVENNAANVHAGTHAFNYWYVDPYRFTLTQIVSQLPKGVYELTAAASGGGGETKLQLYAETGIGSRWNADIVNTGWNVWKEYKVSGIEVANGQVTIGFDVEAPGAAWGWFDDIRLTRTGDLPGTGEPPATGEPPSTLR